MQEHHIRDNHWHNTLVSGCSKSPYNSSANEARVTSHPRLPDVRQDTYHAADEDRWTSTEDVAEGNDNEVRIAKSHGCCSELDVSLDMLAKDGQEKTYKHINLRQSFVKLLNEDWRERRDCKRRQDTDKDEDSLVDDHYCLPCCAPILNSG